MIIFSSEQSQSSVVTPGQGFDGVVEIAGGTGSLLWDGRAVLTAAHVVSGYSFVDVAFEADSGHKTIKSSSILIHPDYDVQNSNADLALVWLTSSAPTLADRYQLFRTSDEIGQLFQAVGFGLFGYGDAPERTNDDYKRVISNTFDVDDQTMLSGLSRYMNWDPVDILFADFDNRLMSEAQNALGRLLPLSGSDNGLGEAEGLIASGDSGGPAFIDGQLAGVASYVTTVSKPSAFEQFSIYPDIDQVKNNSSFGEIAGWQRLSEYQQWIDQEVRAAYVNAPSDQENVKKQILEGNSSATTAYFMVTVSGLRVEGETLSVDYATRNGSALAGEDYLHIEGTLNIYPDEEYALIPVEIISDGVLEQDENFYLDIFNPVGGLFPNDSIKLTAERVILNDDFFS